MSSVISMLSAEEVLPRYILRNGVAVLMENNLDDICKHEIEEDYPEMVNETAQQQIERIKRYQCVVRNLKTKYGGRCQLCGSVFLKKNKEPYSEGHHLYQLSKGGSQDAENVVILCATHHRMMHYADVQLLERKGDKLEIILNGQKRYITYKK